MPEGDNLLNPVFPEENFLRAFCRNDGWLLFEEGAFNGRDRSLLFSSLSFGVYAVLNGLWKSNLAGGGACFAVDGDSLMPFADDDVVPEENLELKVEIQEFRRFASAGRDEVSFVE